LHQRGARALALLFKRHSDTISKQNAKCHTLTESYAASDGLQVPVTFSRQTHF
jgi:hypothetical protein